MMSKDVFLVRRPFHAAPQRCSLVEWYLEADLMSTQSKSWDSSVSFCPVCHASLLRTLTEEDALRGPRVGH